MPDVPQQLGSYSIEMDSLSPVSTPDLTPTSPTSADVGSTSAADMDTCSCSAATVNDIERDNTDKPAEDDKNTQTRESCDLPPSRSKTEIKATESSHSSAKPIPRKNIKLESTSTATDKDIGIFGIVNGKREKLEPQTSSVTCAYNGVTTLKSREHAQPSRSGSKSRSGVTPKRKANAKGSGTNIDEEVIKRRLHIEYQGDEAKILKLMKAVCNFGLEKDVHTPPQKVGIAYEGMKVLLRQMEYNARKDHSAITTIESTHHLYDDLSVGINDEISKTRELITSIKSRAAQIKEMQNNNLIFEAANTMIQNLPPVNVGEKQLSEQENKLQKLQKKKRELGENIMAHVIHTNKAKEELDAMKTTFEKSKDLLKNEKK